MEFTKFKQNSEIAKLNGYWWNPIDDRLINWFAMETLPSFQKLYGRIDGTLKQNVKYKIKIKSNFNSTSIDTNKLVIFAEIGNFGSRNDVLAWVLIGSSVFLCLVVTVFVVLYVSRVYGRVVDSDEYILKLNF